MFSKNDKIHYAGELFTILEVLPLAEDRMYYIVEAIKTKRRLFLLLV